MSGSNSPEPHEVVPDTGEPAEDEGASAEYEDLEITPTKPRVRPSALALERAWD